MLYEALSWQNVVRATGDGSLATELTAKASECIIRDLAAVLGYVRLREVIPAKAAELERRQEAMVAAEREHEAHRARVEALEAEVDKLYATWARLEPSKTLSRKASKAAHEAEDAWRAAAKDLTIERNTLKNEDRRLMQEREGLRNAPLQVERLRATQRPDTPDLDAVLSELGLR